MIRSLVVVAATFAALTGCSSDNSLAAERNGSPPIDPDVQADALVLEVSPAKTFDTDGTVRAFTASVDDPPFEETIEIDLQRPFTLPGLVSGQTINPMYRADLPGSDTPVRGIVSFRTPTLPGNTRAATDNDGAFDIALVDAEYQVTVAPDDPRIPMTTVTLDAGTAEVVDLVLDQGVPVWGQVFQDGAPYVDAEVTVLSSTGLRGASTYTDDEGWFDLRVAPGTYTVRTFGIGDGFDPVLSRVVEVSPQGKRVDFEYPEIELHTVQARALDADGDAIAFVPYRLLASSLDAYGSDARVEVEGLADSQGNIVTRAVSGMYTLELLADGAFTNRRVTEVAVEGRTDLGDIELGGLVPIAGSVLDPFGLPVANAQIRCTEIGFAGRSWTGFTTDLGRFGFDAGGSPLSCAVSPPGTREDLALTRLSIDPNGPETSIEFRRGRPMEGVVRFEGEPEEYALVEVRDPTGRVWGSGLTDGGGRFSIRVAYPQ